MSKEGGDSAPQENAAADGKKDPNASIYENRGSKKLIRVVTVMAYMFSVSFVAIVLSAYYLFLWQPPNPRLLHKHHLQDGPQVEYFVADSPIILTNQTSPHVERATNFFALEIPSEGNGTLNSIMGRSAFDDHSSDNDTPIFLKKMTFGHDIGFNKSLSALRTSLAAILRERKSNFSEGHEYFHETSTSPYKSKRMTDKLHNKSTWGKQSERNVIDKSDYSANFSAKPTGEETTSIPNTTTILRPTINGDGTRRFAASNYIVLHEILRNVDRHDKLPRITVGDEGMNVTTVTNDFQIKNNRIQNSTFSINRTSKATILKLTGTKELSLLSEGSAGAQHSSSDVFPNHDELDPEEGKKLNEDPSDSKFMRNRSADEDSHYQLRSQTSPRNDNALPRYSEALGREWSVSSKNRETQVGTITTRATVVNMEQIQKVVPTVRRKDLLRILTQATAVKEMPTTVSTTTAPEDDLTEGTTITVDRDRAVSAA